VSGTLGPLNLDPAHILDALTPVPCSGPGVCERCRGVLYDDRPLCRNCTVCGEQLGFVTPRVLPITMYTKPSQLRDWLKHYKDSEEGPADAEAASVVGWIMSEFLHRHLPALVDRWGIFDAITVVPSTSRTSTHPLVGALRGDGRFANRLADLLQRDDGAIAHNQADDKAYVATKHARGLRVLLLDDVYTTGAHGQSAAAALHAGGAEVAGLLVLGRRINPDYHERASELWQRQRSTAFDLDVCPWWKPHTEDSVTQAD
jgi:hypothetical protein